MTDNDLVSYPRTGRDALLTAAQSPAALADYLFNLEGFIATFTGAEPTPHTVLAPMTFEQTVTFQATTVMSGGAVIAGDESITGNLTVGGNLTVVGTETIDQTETLLGLLTVNVAAGNIAVFQVGGVTKAHIDATGAYTVGASTTYADGSITTTGTLLATNATLQSLSGTTLLAGGVILQSFSDGGGVAVLRGSNRGSELQVDPLGAFAGGILVGPVTPGAWGGFYTTFNTLDDGATGAATFAGLVTGASSFHALNGTTLATGGTILQAFSDGGGITVVSSGASHQLQIDPNGSFGITVIGHKTTLLLAGTAFTVQNDLLLVKTTGEVDTSNNLLDDGATGAATISGLLTMSAGAHLTGTLAWVNAQTVTLSLTAQTIGAATLTVPNFAGVSDTFAFLTLAQTFAGVKTFSATASFTNASPFSMTNAQVVTVALTAQTVGAATLTVPNFAGASDTFAFLTLAQTLVNKTLTTPTINGATLSGTLAGAATFSGVLTLSATTAFTNASPFSMTNAQVVTVTLTAQTVGAATLTVPNFAGASDTFAFVTLAQTLANKTLASPVFSGDATYDRSLVYGGPALAGAGTSGTLEAATKAGAPVDADFAVPHDGMIVGDTTDSKIYIRLSGAWKSVAVA